MTNSLPWKPWPIEIDGLPINSMAIFHGKLLNNQRVNFDVGILWCFHGFKFLDMSEINHEISGFKSWLEVHCQVAKCEVRMPLESLWHQSYCSCPPATSWVLVDGHDCLQSRLRICYVSRPEGETKEKSTVSLRDRKKMNCPKPQYDVAVAFMLKTQVLSLSTIEYHAIDLPGKPILRNSVRS